MVNFLALSYGVSKLLSLSKKFDIFSTVETHKKLIGDVWHTSYASRVVTEESLYSRHDPQLQFVASFTTLHTKSLPDPLWKFNG